MRSLLPKNDSEAIAPEIGECKVKCVNYLSVYLLDFTHFTLHSHFWTNYYIYLGIITTFLASVVSASSLSKLLDSNLAGILTVGVAVFSAITTFVNPSDKSAQHKKAKEKFSWINIKARRAAIYSLS